MSITQNMTQEAAKCLLFRVPGKGYHLIRMPFTQRVCSAYPMQSFVCGQLLEYPSRPLFAIWSFRHTFFNVVVH